MSSSLTNCPSDQMQSNVREASALLKPMANENRLLILCYLLSGEKSVGELIELLGLGQSSLSQHLARLRLEGLVKTRREAQNVYYSLAPSRASKILASLHAIYCGDELPS